MLSYGAACYTQCGTIQARVLRKPVCACFCIETLSFKSSLVEFCEAETNVFFFHRNAVQLMGAEISIQCFHKIFHLFHQIYKVRQKLMQIRVSSSIQLQKSEDFHIMNNDQDKGIF